MIDGDAKLWHRETTQSSKVDNEQNALDTRRFRFELRRRRRVDTDVPIRHDVVRHPTALQPPELREPHVRALPA